MVIEGNLQRQLPKDAFVFAEFVGERIRLPGRFVEAAGLSGEVPVERTLLARKPGVFRLLSPESLDRILPQWVEAGSSDEPLEVSGSDKSAAIRSSLIPCVFSPRGPGWRLHLPKTAKQLAPVGDHSGVFLLIVEGCVEIWFPDQMRQVLSVPVSARFDLT